MKSNFKSFAMEMLLIISIMLAAMSIFLKYVILNETTYLNIFNKSETYAQIKDYVYKKIDDVLSSKNITVDIKDTIITDDDIKRETDNVLKVVLDYLKTGKNDFQPLDTSVYKQRVSDMLNSIMDNMIKPAGNDLSFNYNSKSENIVSNKEGYNFSSVNYTKAVSKYGQGTIRFKQLMSKSEAEARVREILKEKGLTEEQAIEKAKKKGITEEQALQILESYGITIDDYDSGGSESKSSEENSSDSETKLQNNNENFKGNNSASTEKDSATSNDENQGAANNAQEKSNPKSKLDSIKSKLVDEASKSIDKEVEKLNFDKVFQSTKLQKLAQITSMMYKLFWIFIIAPIVILLILIKMNSKGLGSSLKYIGTAFLIAGLILIIISCGIYILKPYENINISQVYLKDTVYNAAKYILIVILKYGVVVFALGGLSFVPVLGKRFKAE